MLIHTHLLSPFSPFNMTTTYVLMNKLVRLFVLLPFSGPSVSGCVIGDSTGIPVEFTMANRACFNRISVVVFSAWCQRGKGKLAIAINLVYSEHACRALFSSCCLLSKDTCWPINFAKSVEHSSYTYQSAGSAICPYLLLFLHTEHP